MKLKYLLIGFPAFLYCVEEYDSLDVPLHGNICSASNVIRVMILVVILSRHASEKW